MQKRMPVVEVIDDRVAECYRNQTTSFKLNLSWGMMDMGSDIARSSIRHFHPDWTEEQIQREVARRFSHGATDRIVSSSDGSKDVTPGRDVF
jgi:Rv0078B-related antitoxin